MSGTGILTTVLIAALVAVGLYRRMRRSIGRQPVKPGRMILRAVVLSVVGVVFLVFLFRFFEVTGLVEVLAGLVVGVAAGLYGLKMTTFGSDEEGDYYVPNRYLGLAVSALLIARIAYRFLHTSVTGNPASAAAPTSGEAAFQQSYDPVSSALLFVFVGYYVVYYAGVLLESRRKAN